MTAVTISISRLNSCIMCVHRYLMVAFLFFLQSDTRVKSDGIMLRQPDL